MNETFVSSMGFKLLLLLTAGVSVATMGVAASKATAAINKSKIPQSGLEIPKPTESLTSELGSVDLKLIEEIKNKKTEGKCVITLFSKEYDVTEVNKTGGDKDLFDCGKDMSSQYSVKYGNDVSRMEKYLVGAVQNNSTVPTVVPTGSAITTTMPTAAPIQSGDDSMEFEDDDNEREDDEHEDRYEKEEDEKEKDVEDSKDSELESKEN